MELRLALAAVIVVGCGLCGRSLAWGFSRRCRLLEEMLEALRMLRIQIVRMLEPLDRALRQCGSPIFARAADELSIAASVHDAWKAICARECRRGGVADSLVRQDLEALDKLFGQLGESGREAQDAAIRACVASLELALDAAHQRAATAGRLYTSVGFLTGLAIAVLMI